MNVAKGDAGSPRPKFVVPPGSRKHKALGRRRAFQRNGVKWRAWRDECSLGRVVADRAEAGRARPYELGDVAYALRAVCSRRAIEALAWVLAAEKGFGGKRGVVVRHPDMARMLGCCAKSAGDAVRELLDLGLVEQRPHFVRADDPTNHDALDDKSRHYRWYERTPAYQTTAKCRDVVAKREVRLGRRNSRSSFLVGKSYQPPESAANPPGSQKEGVRAQPERAFRDAVLAQRAADAKRAVATAVFRPDRAPCPGVRHRLQPSEAVLLARGSDDRPKRTRAPFSDKSTLEEDLADLWTSFAKHKAGDAAS